MKSWRPRGRSRERILCFGVQGTGKSHAVVTIMQRCVADTFYIIDNDNAWERQIEGTDLEDKVKEEYRGHTEKLVKGEKQITLTRDHEYENPNGRLVIYHCKGWEENIAAIADAVSRSGRDDWIIIDNVTMLWEAVQKSFIEQIFDSKIDRYFLEVRTQKEKQSKSGSDSKSLGALEGWMDWPVINAMYIENVTQHLLNPPGNLFIMAELDTISKEDKDQDIKGLFGPYGVKPKGQKRTGHNPQTVMLMTVTRQGAWKMTTVKDRGTREKVQQMEVDEFAKDYLYRIGGWRVTDVDK